MKLRLFIAGAPKSATTSLKEYLARHEDVLANEGRELTYFINDDEYFLGEKALWDTYFHGLDLDGKTLIAKNVNVMYSRKALERLSEHNPDMVLCLVLRNPVDRAYSAYWYARRRGWEDLDDFEVAAFSDSRRFKGDWILESGCSYLEYGMYAKHLKDVYAVFDPSKVKVYFLEDLKQRPQEVCDELFDALGLSPVEVEVTSERFNKAAEIRSKALLRLAEPRSGVVRSLARRFTSRRFRNAVKRFVAGLNERPFVIPRLSDATRLRLSEFYRVPNQDLAALLGRKVPW